MAIRLITHYSITIGDDEFKFDSQFLNLVQNKSWKIREGYAVTSFRQDGINLTKFMSRLIMESLADIPINYQDLIVDHKDGDTKNNLLSNLRWVTHTQSSINRGLFRNNRTGFPGVSPKKNRFQARICINDVEFFLGVRDTPEQAYYELRLPAEIRYFGEYRRL